ncbi:hypothetical protein FQA47_023400 [Oryzias melastigma]|uniref:Uncharacterized protein n=1 Tax=Oryzias melastigma TaxID=30732 RepID=A0A834FCW0_ORYME|nr:hypothetical protein FQA47_023400 [Oryzias melastigma]
MFCKPASADRRLLSWCCSTRFKGGILRFFRTSCRLSADPFRTETSLQNRVNTKNRGLQNSCKHSELQRFKQLVIKKNTVARKVKDIIQLHNLHTINVKQAEFPNL